MSERENEEAQLEVLPSTPLPVDPASGEKRFMLGSDQDI